MLYLFRPTTLIPLASIINSVKGNQYACIRDFFRGELSVFSLAGTFRALPLPQSEQVTEKRKVIFWQSGIYIWGYSTCDLFMCVSFCLSAPSLLVFFVEGFVWMCAGDKGLFLGIPNIDEEGGWIEAAPVSWPKGNPAVACGRTEKKRNYSCQMLKCCRDVKAQRQPSEMLTVQRR